MADYISKLAGLLKDADSGVTNALYDAAQQDAGYRYGDILPLKVNTQTKQVSPAIPTFVKGLLGSVAAPQRAYQGLLDVNTPQGAAEAANMALNFMGSGAVGGKLAGVQGNWGTLGAIPIYHGTSKEAAQAIEKNGFDLNRSADGSIWFTSDPNIGEVAASGKGGIVKKILDDKKLKLGSYPESDKYSINELMQMGHDGMQYPDNGFTHYQIFYPEKLGK